MIIQLWFLIIVSFWGINCDYSQGEIEETITIEFWTIALGDAFADFINGMIKTYES